MSGGGLDTSVTSSTSRGTMTDETSGLVLCNGTGSISPSLPSKPSTEEANVETVAGPRDSIALSETVPLRPQSGEVPACHPAQAGGHRANRPRHYPQQHGAGVQADPSSHNHINTADSSGNTKKPQHQSNMSQGLVDPVDTTGSCSTVSSSQQHCLLPQDVQIHRHCAAHLPQEATTTQSQV
jgi:hypothetical protein